jgi:hypothetical protein
MGICCINKAYRITSSDVIIDPLADYRNDLIRRLKRIHQVTLSCIKGVETCILKNQQQKAITIISKQFYLKSVSITLQNYINKIDDFIENKRSTELKKNLEKEIQDSWDGLKQELLTDDVEKMVALDFDDEYILQISQLLMVYKNQYKTEIELDLHTRTESLKKLNETSKHKRRKYSKKKL